MREMVRGDLSEACRDEFVLRAGFDVREHRGVAGSEPCAPRTDCRCPRRASSTSGADRHRFSGPSARGLPLFDSLIYTSAQRHGAELLTHDAHFRGLPGVHFVETRTLRTLAVPRTCTPFSPPGTTGVAWRDVRAGVRRRPPRRWCRRGWVVVSFKHRLVIGRSRCSGATASGVRYRERSRGAAQSTEAGAGPNRHYL
jgi:hypothetical protein